MHLLTRRLWCLFLIRHGLKQFRNGWADGPAYITQCPIQSGSSYMYSFNVTGQRGTLWWHAHILWLRATVYGAIVIMPKPGTPYPFPRPAREETLVFGEFVLKKLWIGTESALEMIPCNVKFCGERRWMVACGCGRGCQARKQFGIASKYVRRAYN